MASVLVVLALLTLVVLNYGVRRDWRYPPVLMSVVWLVVVTLYYLGPVRINNVHVLTMMIFISAVVAFSMGGYFASNLTGCIGEKDGHGAQVNSASASGRVKLILLGLSVGALPLIIRRALELASGYDSFLVGLRTEFLAADTGGYGYLNYGFVVSFIATFLYAVEARSGLAQRLQFYLSVVVSFTYAALGTGRSTFLFLMSTLLGVFFIKRGISGKKLVSTGFIFLLTFALLGVATGKGGNPNAPLAENVGLVAESLVMYAIGPLPAFDRIVRADRPLSYGKNVLVGPLNTFRGAAGMTRVSRLREEVYIPFPTNVYTGINAPYLDFGVTGVIFVFLAIGAGSTYFYIKALAGDPLYVFLYAISLYPLLLVTFSDEYFDPLNDWIKYGLCAFLYFRLGKSRQSKPTLV